jgi:ABC-type sugar transport system substrate-binding protein
MKRIRFILLLLPLLCLFSCTNNSTPPPTPNGGPTLPGGDKASPPNAGDRSTGQKLKIGYVLHGLNPFTDIIKRGAEDAGKALDVDVEVVGPSKFEANEAIGMFEGMVQKKKDGIVVVPMPGEVWVRPIKEATDAGIPVTSANITSAESSAEGWFGQDEYQSGVILATEIRKMLEAGGKKSGTILVGICAPDVAVLVERYKGFKKGLEGSGFKATDSKDVKTAKEENYAAWENQVGANKDIVAAVGLCSMDIPNLAKLKKDTGAKWLIGGYDLDPDIITSLKDGTTQISLAQHPYLQGYLPVLAMVQHLRDKKPLPKGWVNVGTEIVTKANVDSISPRETDRAAETKWYADYIAKNVSDLGALAKPLPGTHP